MTMNSDLSGRSPAPIPCPCKKSLEPAVGLERQTQSHLIEGSARAPPESVHHCGRSCHHSPV